MSQKTNPFYFLNSSVKHWPILIPLPFISTKPESYSFYHPTKGRRLSQPSWLVAYQDGSLVRRESYIQVLTRPNVE